MNESQCRTQGLVRPALLLRIDAVSSTSQGSYFRSLPRMQPSQVRAEPASTPHSPDIVANSHVCAANRAIWLVVRPSSEGKMYPRSSLRRLKHCSVMASVMLLLPVVASRAQAGTSAVAPPAVVGTWQGTLPVDKTPRIVLKISATERGTLRGVFTWIDRDADGIALSAVRFVAPELDVASDLVSVHYRGKLAASGASLTGSWTQEGQAYPLLLTKVAPEAAWKHDDSPAVLSMAPSADPMFEVATIKPSADQSKGKRYEWRTRQFRATNVTVADLIRFAFPLRDRQIEGVPSGVAEDRFDIAAEPDAPGLPSQEQYQAMMQKLLQDRFGLKFHMVQRNFPVYALTLGSGALKLTRGDASLCLSGHISVKQEPEGDTEIRFSSESMPEFLGILMNFIDRQVVDETGLSGRFDFIMQVQTTALQSTYMDEKTAAFVRGVQPMGLRMVSKRADLPVMVVDNLERPSPN